MIGTDRSTGVIDWYGHAFGYENLLVCDGAMPANPGVNPSLTITHDRARDALQPTKAMCRRRACVKFAGMSCAQWGISMQRAPANLLIYLNVRSILASS